MFKRTLTILQNNHTNFSKQLLMVMCLCVASPAYSAGTPAGTAIQNHVIVSYQVGSDADAIYTERAAHTFVVSELIRSNVSALEQCRSFKPPCSQRSLVSCWIS